MFLNFTEESLPVVLTKPDGEVPHQASPEPHQQSSLLPGDQVEKPVISSALAGEAKADAEKNDDEKHMKARKPKLIIPPGWDVPIVQQLVNIFDPDVCKMIDWTSVLGTGLAGVPEEPQDTSKVLNPQEELMSKLTCVTGKTALQVRATTWITREEIKKVKSSAPKANCLVATEAHAASPSKPASWNEEPCISPEEQCPPKKRGRKPKAKADDEASQEDKASSSTKAKKKSEQHDKEKKRAPPKKRVRGKTRDKNCEEDGNTPDREDDDPAVEEHQGKKKRQRRVNDDEAPVAEKKRKKDDSCGEKAKRGKTSDGNGADKEASKKTSKGPTRGGKPKPSTRANDDEQECEEEEEEEESEPNAASSTPAQRTRACLEMAKQNRLKKEKKAKYSRKSAAYHKAFRATKGSHEDKKAAAKKVSLFAFRGFRKAHMCAIF